MGDAFTGPKKLVPLSSALACSADLACEPIEWWQACGASIAVPRCVADVALQPLGTGACGCKLSLIERAPWSACSPSYCRRGAFMAPAQAPQTLTRHHLFGGKKEGGGGGALGNVAASWTSQEGPGDRRVAGAADELAAAEFEGERRRRRDLRDERPAAARIAAAPGPTARAPRHDASEAMADARAGRGAMNEKMAG